MKTIILTIAFLITSLVATSQNTLYYHTSRDVTDSVELKYGNDPNIQTIYLHLDENFIADSVKINGVFFDAEIDTSGSPNGIINDTIYATSYYSINTLTIFLSAGVDPIQPKFFKLTFTSVLGVKEVEDVKLSVYPNPATDFVNVEFTTENMNMPVTVYNSAGQLVYSDNDTRYGDVKLRVDMYNFTPGVCFVKVGNKTQQILIE